MKKAVIIGAGPAGLTAGYELLKKTDEYEVTILEESDVVGGIARTVEHNGNRMDIGGHRFFSKSAKVNRWWNEILPRQGEPSYDDKLLDRDVPLMPTGPDPELTDEVMLNRRRVSRIYFDDKFIDYPIKMNSKTLKSLGMGDTWKAGFSYLGGNIVKRQEKSLEDFYINRFGKKLYSLFFEGYTEKLWGRHPKEISPDWGAQRASGLSMGSLVKDVKNKTFNKKNVEDTETSLIERYLYPKYGPGQLWEKVASLFQEMGGTIHYNCKVTRFITGDDKVMGVNCTMGGEEIYVKADLFISSMPLKDLVGGMDNVPRNVAETAYGLPYRDFVTIGLLLPKLSMVNDTDMPTLNNIIPDCWIYVQDPKIKLGRVQIYNNWSPYLLRDPENTVWVGLEYFCTEGDYYWNLSEQQWLEQAVSDLTRMKMIEPGTEVLDYHKEAVLKAYPAYFDTYKNLNDVKKYLDGFSNLYCVGRNGQHRYNNMDHSMLTAFETVDCIITHNPDKSAIWNVNIEQSYIEEKKSNVNTALLGKEEPVMQTSASSRPVPPQKLVPPQKPMAPAVAPDRKNPSAPVEEEEVKPLPRRVRRYPIPTAPQEAAPVEAVSTETVVSEEVPVQGVLEQAISGQAMPQETASQQVPGKQKPSLFAHSAGEVNMPDNLKAARREYLEADDPITQRSVVKKNAPKLNESAENYGVLQDASASSLVLGKSGLIDKTEEEVIKENEVFAKAQEDANAYVAGEDDPQIVKHQAQFDADLDREAAAKKKEEKARLAWQEHLEEIKRQEERNAEIKKRIANGKVIKSTSISSGSVSGVSSPAKKAEPVKENTGKVIAVIKNGVAVPVGNKTEMKEEAQAEKKAPAKSSATKTAATKTATTKTTAAKAPAKTKKAAETAETTDTEKTEPKKRTRKPKEEAVLAEKTEEFIDNPIVKEITIVSEPLEVTAAPKRTRKKKADNPEETEGNQDV